uniref:DUF659 domain-containing protein n=1 Tax=Cannabis sativa TaxID=3483 RepID=A0A803PHB7_CANSA
MSKNEQNKGLRKDPAWKYSVEIEVSEKMIQLKEIMRKVDCGAYFNSGGSGTEIGKDIVVQVITDNASAYKVARKLLMEKKKSLYWTPCGAHCIDLMLGKIGELPQHKNAFLKAKRVSNFIHNHQWVLN